MEGYCYQRMKVRLVAVTEMSRFWRELRGELALRAERQTNKRL